MCFKNILGGLFWLQDTGILTGIVKSLGRVSLDIASLQPLKTRRLRLPLRYNEQASKAHISVEVCYHQFLDVRPGSPSRHNDFDMNLAYFYFARFHQHRHHSAVSRGPHHAARWVGLIGVPSGFLYV